MDLINEMFATPNLPATSLLVLVLLYWLMVIFGGLAMDGFDFDLGSDLDVDVDADLPGADGLEGAGSLLATVLGFFYLGRIPLTLVISVFGLIFWTMSMYGNRYFNPTLETEPLLYMFPGSVFGALIITKIVLWPTVGFFDAINNGAKERPNQLLGLHGEVTSSEVTEKFGQVTIEQNGPPIVLNVFCGELDRFKKGDVVTLIEYNPDKNTYLIAAYAEKK